MSMNK